MAMSRSIRKGQFPVLCNWCDTERKIHWRCEDCNLLMCDACRDTRHSRIKNAENHKILRLRDIGSQSTEPDFSSIRCTKHKGQVCVMFCKSCDQLVCPQCMAGIHNGHQFIEISEGYKIQIQRLIDRQNEIKMKSQVKAENQIKEIKKAENVKYFEAKEKIKAQNVSLKKSADQHTEELLKEVDRRWNTFSSSIEKEEGRIRESKIHNTSINTQLEAILNSNDAEKIFHHIKELEQTLSESEESTNINFTSMPIFIPGEITQYNMGSLQDTTDITIRVVQEYTTDISEVFYMSSSINSLWIGNNDVIQQIQPDINNIKIMAQFDTKFYDLAFTPTNDLLFVSKGKVIKQISYSTGQLQDSIYRTKPLDPIAIHVTSDYKVLIGVNSSGSAFPVTGRRLVISMDKEGNNKTFYEHDICNKSIFSFPRYITTTQTGNICVVDYLSSDGRGRVVVLSQEGAVINTYNGHPTINTTTEPFKPRSIKTTPKDNIILVDFETKVINILNNVGFLITHINSTDIGIPMPYSIAFTGKGKVFIGCNTLKSSTAMAKLYEVKFSE